MAERRTRAKTDATVGELTIPNGENVLDIETYYDGAPHLASLCISVTGESAWARLKENPYSLQKLVLLNGSQYETTRTPYAMGTNILCDCRCNAAHGIFACQRYCDGQILFTDGEDVHFVFYMETDGTAVSVCSDPPLASQVAAVVQHRPQHRPQHHHL